MTLVKTWYTRERMKAKPTTDQKVDELTVGFKSLSRTVKGLSHEVKDLTKTVDNLVCAVAKGFASVDKRFEENDRMHQLFVDEFRLMHAGIKDIKRPMESLISLASENDREISTLDLRVTRVEEKVGLGGK